MTCIYMCIYIYIDRCICLHTGVAPPVFEPGHLCEANPDVKFLFTVLSRTDQHEAGGFVIYTAFKEFLTIRIWKCADADLDSTVQAPQSKRLASAYLSWSRFPNRDNLAAGLRSDVLQERFACTFMSSVLREQECKAVACCCCIAESSQEAKCP